jgi:hypothetical protein
MSQLVVDQFKNILKINTIDLATNRTDIVIRSKNRLAVEKTLKAYFKEKNIKFKKVSNKKKSPHIDVIEVEGIIGNILFEPLTQKGPGGLLFEKQLSLDLKRWFHGATDLHNEDVIKALQNKIDLDPNKYSKFQVLHVGKRNTRRRAEFTNNFILKNSSGEDISDIIIKTDLETYYLSLKFSPSFYIVNTSVLEYFLNPSINSRFCEYFGFDGVKIGNFGPKFVCNTKDIPLTIVKSNLENVISQAYGNNVVVVHKKKQDDVSIVNIENKLNVIVSDLTKNSYIYPERGIRKYADIKCNARIGNKNYKVNFQFRGTEMSDLSPKQLHILLVG